MKQGLELVVAVLVVAVALMYLARRAVRKFRSPLCGEGCACTSKLKKNG